uniref:Uncharacterized protein n=1 Tax=Culex quinquefasciatus TaxID=7176 RepID=A0A1S4KI06_CULQU
LFLPLWNPPRHLLQTRLLHLPPITPLIPQRLQRPSPGRITSRIRPMNLPLQPLQLDINRLLHHLLLPRKQHRLHILPQVGHNAVSQPSRHAQIANRPKFALLTRRRKSTLPLARRVNLGPEAVQQRLFPRIH